MRILVTGSQGTLGIPLVAELRKRGYRVTGADLYHGIGEIRADVSESRQVERVFSEIQPDICYHLAAEFGRVNGQRYYEQLWRTNCLGTRNVIESCIAHRTRLIFASSSEAYGSLADEGILEEFRLDSEVPRFHNEYALTKWTNEQQIKTAINNDGLKATILRFFNVYGPGEKYSDYRSVICLFIYRLMKGIPVKVFTKTTRSFLYVDDWTHAVANTCERELPNGEAYNIASVQEKNLLDVYHLVSQAVGKTTPAYLTDNEKMNIAIKKASVVKAHEALGLHESVTLVDGILRTVEWMRLTYGS